MKNLLSLFTISLFFISFQSMANRPAEDDPSAYPKPSATDTNSNIPAPVAENSEAIPDQSPLQNIEAETQQPENSIQPEDAPAQRHVILLDFPQRGMDMSKVLNELGEPTRRFPAIGTPPITRWVYPDRTVFFEYTHVIHVVAQ
ncbi:MAG: hypothetical protein OEY29_00340 [Gammaproteobacteria bacterium]|nr:hypothetical protein [Gammaproteobacteria bacterium]